MCSRYSLVKSKDKIAQRFNIAIHEPLKARYNIAPAQTVPVITSRNPAEATFCKWGLIPMWSLNESGSHNMINAKAESILTKAPYKQYLKNQRCIVLADGYYEWKREGRNRIPHRITLSSDELFAFAGFWDSWETPLGDIINSFTIVTTSANAILRGIHDRMPVILPKDLEREWLSENLNQFEIEALLKPYDGDKISYYKCHKIINSTDYDIPECIQVAPKIYPGETYSLFE